MSDLTVAVDETAATQLVHDAETAVGTISRSGSGSLGPFNAAWSVSASFSGGSIDLIAPNVIRIANCKMNYSLGLNFSFDLSSILPDFCLPQICIPIPFNGEICTPKICIDWPTINIPVSYSDSLTFTADFSLNPHLDGSDWVVDIVIVGIPSLNLGPAASAILTAIGLAAAAILAPIPFIGPFLAIAVAAIAAAIGIAGVTGLLGPILSLFVSGLSFEVFRQPRIFPVLPASLPFDPAVNIRLDSVGAADVPSDEDELVISVDICPA
jgi:hypothetical protein